MANSSSLKIVNPKPLTAYDKGALLASVVPVPVWQAAFVAESTLDPVQLSGTSVAAANDLWEIVLVLPSAMQGYVWVPFRHHGWLRDPAEGDTGFANLFDTTAWYRLYNTNAAWTQFSLSSAELVYNGGNEDWIQDATPPLRAVPSRPVAATSATSRDNALGAFQFRIGTWDATAGAGAVFIADCVYLGFPQNALNSAGWYQPRQYFAPV